MILNELNDSTEERVSIRSESNESSNSSDKIESASITLGSDGKPKRRKRSGKSTISIITK